MSDTVVFVGVPHSGTIAADSGDGLAQASERGVPYCIKREGSSALTRNFNALLLACRSMTPRPTHFAMHHSDIVAQTGWLDVLLGELRAHDADVISTVMPIKDERGLSTTGAFSADFTKIKRFTMRELDATPWTFVAPPGRALAINTGLMLMRTDRPWFKDLVFRFEDEITERDGKPLVLCRSEDWLMSEFLAKAGAKVCVTRMPRAFHVGFKAWSNQGAWGTEKEEDGKWWR